MDVIGKLNFLFRHDKLKFVMAIAASVVSFMFVVETQDVYGIQYLNHTSEKYQIQFQYPSDWVLDEKTGRFDEGDDISIATSNALVSVGINYYADLIAGFGSSNLESTVNGWMGQVRASDYSYEYKTIESPSFFNIDGQKTGTFVYTGKEKYSTDAVTVAVQPWITFIGSGGYLISFMTTSDMFDSPENIEIRDHLIKSIKFLGASDTTQSN